MDVVTVIVVSSVILLVIGAVFAAIHKMTTETVPPLMWAGATAGFAIGYLLFLGRGTLPDFLTVVVANVLLMTANIVFFIGTVFLA